LNVLETSQVRSPEAVFDGG